MISIWDSFGGALRLILFLDMDLLHICMASIGVSLVSTILASLAGLPLGILIGTNSFRGKRTVTALINTLFALPTVAVGVFVYCFISRCGPFGSWELLFTPAAIVIGQFILATPIITALTIAAVEGVDRRLEPTAKTLGANAWQANAAVLYESRHAAAAAVAAGFGTPLSRWMITLTISAIARSTIPRASASSKLPLPVSRMMAAGTVLV